MWIHILAVAAGGAVGSVARFLVAEVSASRLGTTFPYGTLIVNVIGSFVLGLITGLVVSRAGLPMTVSTLVGVGFCGAFTTFSTFAVDTLTQRSVGMALLNLMLNNAVAIGAAAAALYLILRH
jgi:fluoride exporter